MLDFLISYGCVGMFIASFFAGSVFPFSSEAVMTGLQLIGTPLVPLFISATTGNVLGSMFNYWVGSLGDPVKVQKYTHVSPEKMERALVFVQKYGAWLGFFTFIPVVGSVLSVTLGFLRANPWLSLLSITLGKSLRYAFLIWLVMQVSD